MPRFLDPEFPSECSQSSVRSHPTSLRLPKYEGPIPVAARSKAQVCGHLVAGIAGSNPAEGMDVCLLCL
jgi:hypothetical protein